MCGLFFTHFRFLVHHLDLRRNGALDKVGNNTVEINDPENMDAECGHWNYVRITSCTVTRLIRGGLQLCIPAVGLKHIIRSAIGGLSLKLAAHIIFEELAEVNARAKCSE